MALVLWQVRGVRVRATDGRRALVDRRETSSAHLEFRELVVVDLDSVPGVAVPSGDALSRLVSPGQICETHCGASIKTYLCDNFRVRVEV